MSLLILWLINAVSLLVIDRLLPGVAVGGLYTALVVVIILGLINLTIRPIVLLLTLPVNFLTLGLFTFAINALMLWLASTIVKGFVVDGFTSALLASLLLGAMNFIVQGLRHSFRS